METDELKTGPAVVWVVIWLPETSLSRSRVESLFVHRLDTQVAHNQVPALIMPERQRRAHGRDLSRKICRSEHRFQINNGGSWFFEP